MPKPHLFNLTPEQLEGHVTDWGMPRFRAKQVMQWVYERGVGDFAEMTNLSKADRATLSEKLDLTRGQIVGKQSATDGVEKLLIDWSPQTALPQLGSSATQTECVMIPADTPGSSRRTACISSQIGCPVGCTFCASGLGGLDGNLTAGQIVEQAWVLSGFGVRASGFAEDGSAPHASAKPETRNPKPDRITNIVFMGMGEPLANFEAVAGAIRTLTAPWGMGISARRITVSTVGLPAQIRRLADLDIPVTLAISLHAPNDDLRRTLIPWADYVTIEQLLAAGRHYFDRTGREITLEYILLGGVNDRAEHAQQLARVAKTLRSNVNLIRYNEVKGMPFNRPATEDVHRFQQLLRKAGVNAHIRASRGRDIAAACGQLRHEHAQA